MQADRDERQPHCVLVVTVQEGEKHKKFTSVNLRVLSFTEMDDLVTGQSP